MAEAQCDLTKVEYMKPTVIALITAQNIDQEQLGADFAIADLWELRYDTFDAGTDLGGLIQKLRQRDPSKPILLTVRMERDGGNWPTADSWSRLAIWEQALRLGIEWIDIETEVEENQRQKLWELRQACGAETQILVSHHDFKSAGDLARLQERFDSMQSPYAHAYKMALTFENPIEEAEMTKFLSSKPKNLISCFSMGALGQKSRLLSPYQGAPWTYGFVGEIASAPGQLSVRFLRNAYDQGLREL